MSSDIDRLRADTSLSDLAMRFGVALQKNGDEWEAACPFHEEDTPSFTIFPGRDGVERYHCFGCGQRGDVMDFVQGIKGVDLKEAINILGGRSQRDNVAPKRIATARNIYEGIEPLPPAGELKAGRRVKLWNPKREKPGTVTPSMVFPYRRADGSLIGYVLRNDFTDANGKAKKETPMVMWCRLPDGSTEWTRYPFDKPRTLYHLEHLKPQGQIIIAEGEKCADIGAAVTGRLFLSWPGGTYGVNHVDWSPLAGRSVVIWPDADAPGRDTANRIAAILHGMGCAVKVMEVTGKPDGWDVADAADDGWTREEIDAFMRSTVRTWQPDPDPEPDPPAPEPEPPREPDYVPPHYDEAAQWEPDPFASYGDMELDKDDGQLIEYSPGQRRVVPPSGRVMAYGHWRAWGGDHDALREWAFLTGPEKFCNVHTGQIMSVSAFDRTRKTITPMIEKENGKGEVKNQKVKPSEYLLEYGDGLECHATMYRPDIPDMMAWVDGILHLNSFLPSSVPETDPGWENHPAWRVAKDHIENIIPDGAALIIQWLAHNVQFPGRKILWAPILVGEQGDGKTSIAKILQMAMGRRNVQPVGPEELFSDYTSWAEGVCVRVLEELHQDGVNRSSVVDKLKAPITNDDVPVVGKGEKGKAVANVTNYLGLTNHISALRIPAGDRRFGVWRTRFSNREQVVAELSREYWKRLHDAIGGNPGVMRGWLLSVDLSDFDRLSGPEMTAAKRDMIEAGRSPTEAAFLAALDLGGVGIGETVLATDYVTQAIREAEGRAPAGVTLSGLLRSNGWVKAERRLKWKEKNRHVYFKPGPWSEGMEWEGLSRALRMRLDDTELNQPEERQDANLDLENW